MDGDEWRPPTLEAAEAEESSANRKDYLSDASLFGNSEDEADPFNFDDIARALDKVKQIEEDYGDYSDKVLKPELSHVHIGPAKPSSVKAKETPQHAHFMIWCENMYQLLQGMMENPKYLKNDKNINRLKQELEEAENLLQHLFFSHIFWPLRNVCQMLVVSVAVHFLTTCKADEEIDAIHTLLQKLCREDSLEDLLRILQMRNAVCVSGTDFSNVVCSTIIKTFDLTTDKPDYVNALMKKCARLCDEEDNLAKLFCFLTASLIICTIGKYVSFTKRAVKQFHYHTMLAAACLSTFLAYPGKWKDWYITSLPKEELLCLTEKTLGPIVKNLFDFIDKLKPWNHCVTYVFFEAHGAPHKAETLDEVRNKLGSQQRGPQYKVVKALLDWYIKKRDIERKQQQEERVAIRLQAWVRGMLARRHVRMVRALKEEAARMLV